MKKSLLILLAVLLALAAGWMIFSGLQTRTDVFIQDFTVSEDGTSITFTVGIGSSMGCTRGFKDETRRDARVLTFYDCWGGFNSPLGAKDTFTLSLRPEDTAIAIARQNEAEVVLEKGEDGTWYRKGDEPALRSGVYEAVGDYEEGMTPYIHLDTDSRQFSMGQGFALSYAEQGTYSVENDTLICPSPNAEFRFTVKDADTLELTVNGDTEVFKDLVGLQFVFSVDP